MGLDVYLYTKAEHEQNQRHDDEWGALWSRKQSGEVTDEQYEAEYPKIAQWTSNTNVPSERYPGHLFNRRYLRSSYNGSGFNHAVPDLIETAGQDEYPGERGSLYWIFEPLSNELESLDELTADAIPRLLQCKSRALDVVRWLGASDQLRVTTVSANQLGGIEWLSRSDADALALYREEAARNATRSPLGWSYSTRDMEVHPAGFTILAAIPGGNKRFFSDDRWPAVHLVYKADEAHESYVQSAEITAEFCDEAIGLIERDGVCYMRWSA